MSTVEDRRKVHQTRDGAPDDSQARPDEVCGHCDGHHRVASDAELTKATLHDTLGAVTTESVESVSGKSRTSASTGAKVFLGVLIGAAVVGGVAAIALSAGAAAMPGIIVALEAAGDVVVGTELVDVSVGSTP